MIFIVVKFPVLPEKSDDWLSIVADFTAGVRAEPGNLFFDWSRSADDPNEWVVVEGYRDQEAAVAHVSSEHFKTAMAMLPDAISATPRIINTQVPGEDFGDMAELKPRNA
ncbi:MAG TPA: putative quinol monooxygenase [Amycolatopsis sp.]|jgi:quinol monooxygenase YgiN|uniref:putative quinol monooxygenase n=1 Tax=Amycolatopsis sp. NBC_01480 TaxID=2903562 RepID=UPI002E2BC100|nr:putative quinol monooxygenase [Amycolatopsis sp. NBC_01480]